MKCEDLAKRLLLDIKIRIEFFMFEANNKYTHNKINHALNTILNNYKYYEDERIDITSDCVMKFSNPTTIKLRFKPGNLFSKTICKEMGVEIINAIN